MTSQACIEEVELHMSAVYSPEQIREFMSSEEAHRAAAKKILGELDKNDRLHELLITEVSTNRSCQESAVFNALTEMAEQLPVNLDEEVAA